MKRVSPIRYFMYILRNKILGLTGARKNLLGIKWYIYFTVCVPRKIPSDPYDVQYHDSIFTIRQYSDYAIIGFFF